MSVGTTLNCVAPRYSEPRSMAVDSVKGYPPTAAANSELLPALLLASTALPNRKVSILDGQFWQREGLPELKAV